MSDLDGQEREAMEEALKRMIAVTELPGTRGELSVQTENAKSFARAALAAREEPGITVGERWEHHSTGIYVVKRVYADEGRWRVTIREEETDKLSEAWADYFRENFTLVAAREEPQPTTAQIETAGYLTAILGEPARDGVVSAKRGDQEFFVRPDGTLESGIMELNQAEVEGLPHRVGVKRRVRYDDMVGRVESMLLGNFGVNYPRIQWNSVARRVLDLALSAAREDTERPVSQGHRLDRISFFCGYYSAANTLLYETIKPSNNPAVKNFAERAWKATGADAHLDTEEER